MSDCFENIVIWNKNNSHPDFQEYLIGELCLHDNGMLFTFIDGHHRTPLAIPWKNLTSTFISSHKSLKLVPFLTLNRPSVLASMSLWTGFGVNLGSVSIKYKDAEYDKIIVIEFIRPYGIIFTHAAWAKDLDRKIWQYKKDDRWS